MSRVRYWQVVVTVHGLLIASDLTAMAVVLITGGGWSGCVFGAVGLAFGAPFLAFCAVPRLRAELAARAADGRRAVAARIDELEKELGIS